MPKYTLPIRIVACSMLFLLFGLNGCQKETKNQAQLLESALSNGLGINTAANPAKDSAARVFMIVIDGGDWEVLKPLLRKGAMPNLKFLIHNGSAGTFLSTIPPQTPVAVPTIFSGYAPGDTGLSGFTLPTRKGYERRIIDSRDLPGPLLWETVEENGGQSVVISVPFTYPIRATGKGIMVSGWLSPPGENFCHPPELSKILSKMGYQPSFDPNETKLRQINESHKIKVRLARWLQDKVPWDLFVLYFEQTIFVQSFFSNRPDLIEGYYRLWDKDLGKIRAKLKDNDVLLVISDHGDKPFSKMFDLYGWLEEEGLLKFRDFSLLRSLDVDLGHNPDLESLIDFTHTRVFSIGGEGAYGSLTLNLKNREALGIVAVSDYDDMRNRLKARLESLKDEQSDPIVEKVWFREELYPGSRTNELPDMYFKLRNDHYVFYHPTRLIHLPLVSPLKRPHHRREGIFILWGKGIPKRHGFIMRAEQIAPLVLKTLRMRQKIDPKTRNRPSSTTRGSKEGAIILERLKSLGYVY